MFSVSISALDSQLSYYLSSNSLRGLILATDDLGLTFQPFLSMMIEHIGLWYLPFKGISKWKVLSFQCSVLISNLLPYTLSPYCFLTLIICLVWVALLGHIYPSGASWGSLGMISCCSPPGTLCLSLFYFSADHLLLLYTYLHYLRHFLCLFSATFVAAHFPHSIIFFFLNWTISSFSLYHFRGAFMVWAAGAWIVLIRTVAGELHRILLSRKTVIPWTHWTYLGIR